MSIIVVAFGSHVVCVSLLASLNLHIDREINFYKAPSDVFRLLAVARH